MTKCWVIEKSKATTFKDLGKIKADEILEIKENVELPDISEDESLIKINSAGLNFNSIWSSKLYPVDPFNLVNGHVRRNQSDKKHIKDYFIPGSDACGTIVKTQNNSKFKEGDEIVVHCAVIDSEGMQLSDPMLSKSQSIWGYETNFGAFSEYAIVKNSQLLRKPAKVDAKICGSYMLTLGTAYRMIKSSNGGNLKSGETCLIWGASGGLGIFAIQLVKKVGGIPICIVSTREKADYCKKFGAEHIICLSELENKDFLINNEFNMRSWMEISVLIKKLIGQEKVDMVFEHVGRETMALSIYLLRRGGRVVTCAATSGFLAKIDIRYVWMEMKRLIGSHFCNLKEAEEANELIADGSIIHQPSKIISFDEIPKYLRLMDERKSLGKIAVDMNA